MNPINIIFDMIALIFGVGSLLGFVLVFKLLTDPEVCEQVEEDE